MKKDNKKMFFIMILIGLIMMIYGKKEATGVDVVVLQKWQPSQVSGDQQIISTDAYTDGLDNLILSITVKNTAGASKTYLIEATPWGGAKTGKKIASLVCDPLRPDQRYVIKTIPAGATTTFYIDFPTDMMMSEFGYGTSYFGVRSYDSCCFTNPSCAAVSPFFDFIEGQTENVIAKVQYKSVSLTCLDGTADGACSTNKPKYCDITNFGGLYDNCQICGCLSGQSCQADGSCNACTDSDGGKIYDIRGTTTAANGDIEKDECKLDGYFIKERYCKPDGTIGIEEYDCRNMGSSCEFGLEGASCIPTSCTPECSSGQTRCLNINTQQICGNYDADSCLEWGGDISCPNKCSNNQCPSGVFEILQATATKSGNRFIATYKIKNIGQTSKTFIVETQVNYQDKKTATPSIPQLCNINCHNNVYQGVTLAPQEEVTLSMTVPPIIYPNLPNGEYFVRAISSDKCCAGNPYPPCNENEGPFPIGNHLYLLENQQISSGIQPYNLCPNIYCGDGLCENTERYLCNFSKEPACRPCPSDCPATCEVGGCEGWTDVGCAISPCLINQMKQIRTCDIQGCPLWQCLDNPTCGKSCTALNIGEEINCTTSGCPGKSECQNNQWQPCVKDDPDCGITCAYLKGEWKPDSCPTGMINITSSVKDISGRPGTNYKCCKSSGNGDGGDGDGSTTDYGKYMPLLFGLIALIAISRMGGSK